MLFRFHLGKTNSILTTSGDFAMDRDIRKIGNVSTKNRFDRDWSGRDRRSGVDTRSEEEKRQQGERRSGVDRRSGKDRPAP